MSEKEYTDKLKKISNKGLKEFKKMVNLKKINAEEIIGKQLSEKADCDIKMHYINEEIAKRKDKNHISNKFAAVSKMKKRWNSWKTKPEYNAYQYDENLILMIKFSNRHFFLYEQDGEGFGNFVKRKTYYMSSAKEDSLIPANIAIRILTFLEIAENSNSVE